MNANTNSLYYVLFTYAKWTIFCSRLCDGNFYANFELTFILFFYFIHIYIALPEWIFFKAYMRENFSFLFFFPYEFRNVNLLWLQQSPEKKNYQDLQHIQKNIFSVTSSVKFCTEEKDEKGNFKLFLYLYKFFHFHFKNKIWQNSRRDEFFTRIYRWMNHQCFFVRKVPFYSFTLRVH